MVKAQYTVSLYSSQHAAAFQEFADHFWPREDPSIDNSYSPSQVTVNESDRIENKPPTFLFLKDEAVIGHITSLPVRLSTPSAITQAHWVVGFMVLPEHRNGLVGPYLIKKVNQTLDLAMSLHVEEPVLKILKGLGWYHVGVIPQYVHVLNGYRLVRNIRAQQMSFFNQHGGFWGRGLQFLASKRLAQITMGLLAQLAVRSWLLATTSARRSGRALYVAEEHEFDSSYDSFWDRVGMKFEALVVRDRAYLQARYGRTLKHYKLLACREKDELRGFFILKIRQFQDDPRMGWLRIATIIDCLFDPSHPQSLQALLSASFKRLTGEGVDVIFCTASHRAVQELLVKNAFIKMPGNLNFAYHDRTGSINKHVSLRAWHLMRGDSDAAANF